MAKKTTPTFVVELPLSMSLRDQREALIRLELGRRLYNACLGEALHRLDVLRNSLDYQRARALSRTSQKKERADAFKAINHQYGFTSASISSFGTQCKNNAKWNLGRKSTDPRLGAHETQRIAERSFASAEQYAFGDRGRPRFKGKHRPLHSLEGKSAGSSLCWNKSLACLQWGGLHLFAQLPPVGKDWWLEAALPARTKYARIVWRRIKGERRWFVQLMQEGLSPLKYQTKNKTKIAYDVGPSTIAVYSETAVALLPLAPEVIQPWKETKRLQRAMDRSRRATNPQCYNANGTWKKGTKVSVRSTAYKNLQTRLAETERVLSKTRDRSHGKLANQMMGLGNMHQSEKLSYVAFQKCFGRSTKVRAVGALMVKLRRKVERTDGECVDLDTWRLKLSQYDHTTGTCVKKPLKQRWHRLGAEAGVSQWVVQRDMYSAFLAFCVDTGGNAGNVHSINPSYAEQAWPVAQSLLSYAGLIGHQSVNVAGLLAATMKKGGGLPPPQPSSERIAFQRDLAKRNAQSVQHGKALGSDLRTPCL